MQLHGIQDTLLPNEQFFLKFRLHSPQSYAVIQRYTAKGKPVRNGLRDGLTDPKPDLSACIDLAPNATY
jgi:hypothetical protein